MSNLIVLGSSSAVPDEHHENTHMVFAGEEHAVLVDCVNTPTVRLRRAGVDLDRLTSLVLTHFHPDHVAGVPPLLMNLWLLGRKHPLDVYGLADTIDRTIAVMEAYAWHEWPNFYPVHFHRIPAEEMSLVFEDSDFRVIASPVKHLIPNIGVRVESLRSGKIAVYTSDTEPCPEVVRLAAGADILLHEATGESAGHSSAAQAGEAAHQAGVQHLYLIHYNPEGEHVAGLVSEARKAFDGPISVAQDYMRIPF